MSSYPLTSLKEILNLSIYVYVYVCMCVCVCMWGWGGGGGLVVRDGTKGGGCSRGWDDAGGCMDEEVKKEGGGGGAEVAPVKIDPTPLFYYSFYSALPQS